MASLDVKLRIDRVTDALNGKGFSGIYATHYDNSPAPMIVLHDDHGRVAHGEDEAVTRIIEESGDESGLWSALGSSGLLRTGSTKRS